MTGIISAFADGNRDIKALGLVSTKYKDEPCHLCGACRQFFSEIINKLEINPDIYCFAKEADIYKKFKINQILPHEWSSKKL